jgi:acetylglutamate kinase
MVIEGIAGLKGALGYVRAYRGKTFVVKIGGEVLGDVRARDALATQIGLLHSLGIRCVLVHGGGPQATDLARRLGVEPMIVAGRRVTDDAQLAIAKMAFAGAVNVDLLAALRRSHVPAVGLTGVDAELLTASRRPPKSVRCDDGIDRIVDFGHVGDIERVDASVLEALLGSGFVPVVSSLAGDAEGNVYNVNADTVAERIAVALKAAKLLILTGAPGVLRDPSDPATVVSFADASDVESLVTTGAVSGGMLPKLEACVRAAEGGVERTHILDGRTPDALLLEVFTGAGCGTMIVRRKDKEVYANAELAG